MIRTGLTAMVCLLFLTSCQRKPDGPVKMLIGATTMVSQGAAPIQDSIVLIAGTKIQAVGTRKEVDIPKATDRTDMSGEWIVPAAGSVIAPGERANLLILKHPPNGNTSDATAMIVDGEWKLPGK